VLLPCFHGPKRVVSAYKVRSKLEHVIVESLALLKVLGADPHPHLQALAVAGLDHLLGDIVRTYVDTVAERGVDLGTRKGLVLIVVEVDYLKAGRGSVESGDTPSILPSSHSLNLCEDICVER
jgi:hypothetical protein